MDLIDYITRWETGALDGEEELELFRHLVETGMAWQLQGAYGRHAARLIDAGLIPHPDPPHGIES